MPSFGIVNSTQLNLRARPTTESEIVRVLSRDTNLEIVRDAGFNWLEVKVLPEGQRGFVSKLYVRITNTPDGGGGTPSPTPEPLTGQGEVTASALNIRSAPSLSALVLMSVKQGTRLNLIEKIGDWIKIRLDDGREAFAAAQFVNLKPASSPSPTPDPSPNPTPVPRPGYLISNPELLATPLPPRTLIPPQRPGSSDAVIERVWNNYGGLLSALSEMLNIPVNTVIAVLAAESGGVGFGPNNRMIIRFEVHIFYRYWGMNNQTLFDQHFTFDRGTQFRGHKWRPNPAEVFQDFHGDQEKEWITFSFARRLADASAMLSISMGAPQIMGFNFARLGYKNVQEMFDRFSTSIQAQLIGVFDFVRGTGAVSPAIQALQRRDYLTFAGIYNGQGNAPTYSTIIQNYVVIFNRLIALAQPR